MKNHASPRVAGRFSCLTAVSCLLSTNPVLAAWSGAHPGLHAGLTGAGGTSNVHAAGHHGPSGFASLLGTAHNGIGGVSNGGSSNNSSAVPGSLTGFNAASHHGALHNTLAHSLPVSALTTGLGTQGNRLDLDLTSQQANIVLGTKLFQGQSYVTIDVGGVSKVFSPGSQVTAAEFVAIKQVLTDKSQGLVINSQGAASGGHFSINSVASPKLLELVIPSDVIGVDNFSSRNQLAIGGNLINYGSIVGIATDNRNSSGVISAHNINNQSTGVISTQLTATILAALGSDANLNVLSLSIGHDSGNASLTLSAINDITNSGTVTSAGALNLVSGSGVIYNHGLMSAVRGDINISSPNAASDINILASNGTFQANAGNINVRDASYTGVANTTLIGGNYLSQNLNIYSGGGTITGNVGNVTGRLNTQAQVEHFVAQSKILALGNNCVNGDPTFVNPTGSIQIQGLNTFGEDVAILAADNITADSAGQIVANGHNVTLVAGAVVTTSGSSTSTVPGAQIGAADTVTVNFTPGLGNGGNIDLTGSNATKVIDTSNVGFAGNVVLAAEAKGATGGNVLLNPASTIATGSGTSGSPSGNVTVLAGANPAVAGQTVQLGNVDTTGAAGAIGGNINVATAQPTASGGSIALFNSAGQIAFGGPIVAGTAADRGQIATQALSAQGNVNLTANAVVLSATSPVSAGGNVTINTTRLTNNATISSSQPAGTIAVSSAESLTLDGTGQMKLTGGGAGNISLSAGGPNILALKGSQTFDAGASGTVSFKSDESGGTISLAGGTTETIKSGSAVLISAPNLIFAGDGATFAATGPSAVTVNGGGEVSPLTITVPDSGAGTISTNGGTISITSTPGQSLEFAKSAGSGTSIFNLDGGAINTSSPAAMTMVDSGVTLASDNTITLSAPSGLYGIAFQPYVGPWVGGIPVLFNTYTLSQVTQMLTPVAADFTTISTYGQGFAPPDVNHVAPFARDSDQYIIQAASTLNVNVSAGINQWVISTDNWDLSVSEAEIDYAIAQAKTYGNVTELVVTNESIIDATTAGFVLTLIQYAQTARTNAGYTATTMPVTTRQRWDILGGVSNTGVSYQPTLKTILQTVDGYVYANMYPYYDVGGSTDIATQLGPNPTQASFTSVVQSHMTSHVNALQGSFNTESLTTVIRVGETGWPTQGTNFPQTDAALANTTYASWYYQAMQAWTGLGSGSAPIGGYFEALNEPWKGNAAGTSSEQWFGLWQANGTSTAANQYTLNSVTPVFTLSSARAVQVMGNVSAANVQMNTPALINNGVISATAPTGNVNVTNNAALALSGSGLISRTGAGAGAINFKAGGPNALSFTGTETIDPGASGTFTSSSLGTNGSIVVAGTINFPSTKTVANFNSSSFTISGTINSGGNPATVINLNTSGSGVIANPGGNLDLKDFSVNTGGGNLSIISSANIINTGLPVTINLSSPTQAGGNLVMLAGYTLTPVTGPSTTLGVGPQYTVGAPSVSGGSIVLNIPGHVVNIDTSGATDGGSVSAYATNFIALQDVSAKGTSGTGAAISIQAVGVTARDIDASGGTAAGSLLITSQALGLNGAVVSAGTITNLSPTFGALGGNITVGNLKVASLAMATDGSASTISFASLAPTANSVSIFAGSGTLTLPSNTLTVTQNGSGDGGVISLTAGKFVYGVGPLILSAIGTGAGVGGTVSFFNTSGNALTIDSSVLQINATGVNGGQVSVSSGGNLTFTATGVLNNAPTGKNGDGGSITLSAGRDYLGQPTSKATGILKLNGGLSANAAGTGKGGSIALESNSSKLFTLSVPLSVQGQTLGDISVANKAGGLTIAQALQANKLTLVTAFNSLTSGQTKPNLAINKIPAVSDLDITVGAGGRLTSAGTLIAPTMTLTTNNALLTLNINTSNLTVHGGGNTTLTNKGTGLLTVLASDSTGTLSITSAGDLSTVGDISGTSVTLKTSANNGDIVFGGKVTATNLTKGVATITANGSGTITALAPTDFITANQVKITSTSGAVGSGTVLATALPVSTGNLSVRTTGLVNAADNTAVNLTGASSKGSFTLTAAGQITISAALNTESAIKLDNSTVSADIVISRLVGSTTATKTIDLLTQGQVISGTQTLTAATSISLETIGTNLASKSSPIKVNTPLLAVNGVYPGFGNVVNIADSFRGTVTLANSTVGGNLVLTTTGATNLNDITATNGSISVISSSGQLQVNPGANITTASKLAAGSGSILLQGSNASTSTILIGAGANIATTLAGGGSVTLLTGKGPATSTNALPAGTSGNTKVVLTGGSVFGGIGFVSNGPVNTLTAIGQNVIIDGSSATKITFNGGVTITADPPAASATQSAPSLVATPVTYAVAAPIPAAAPLQVVATSTPTGSEFIAQTVSVANGSISTTSIDATASLSAVNAVALSSLPSALKTAPLTIAPDDNIFLGGVSADTDGGSGKTYDLDATIFSDTDFGLVQGNTRTSRVSLKEGNTLFAPAADTTIETPFGVITVAAKSVAVVVLRDDLLTVFNLHDTHRDSVVITSGEHKLAVAPGGHLSLARGDNDRFETINPAEGICHRSMRHKVLNNGLHSFSSEAAIPSVVNNVKPLRAIFQSSHPEARRLAGSIVKTTAILFSISANQTPYQEIPHPRLTAYSR
ncbi:MAG: hypothetical protein JSS83_09955 [Cyanobacteria bacterium SZAS LIN-3]|nr:hypothetical protein [Cyanobacteria bacterium SZAS LIN-3]